mmetsp:Transcript_62049/g.201143  ORF Transcript_62049/g.201143 Transcript_62049/m.201143 type:complete len:135 (-) Transcript_62049:12-416(-)
MFPDCLPAQQQSVKSEETSIKAAEANLQASPSMPNARLKTWLPPWHLRLQGVKGHPPSPNLARSPEEKPSTERPAEICHSTVAPKHRSTAVGVRQNTNAGAAKLLPTILPKVNALLWEAIHEQSRESDKGFVVK